MVQVSCFLENWCEKVDKSCLKQHTSDIFNLSFSRIIKFLLITSHKSEADL